MRLSDLRAVARFQLAGVVLLAALAATGCARKGDPVPPADAVRSETPPVVAPGEITRPIQDLEDF